MFCYVLHGCLLWHTWYISFYFLLIVVVYSADKGPHFIHVWILSKFSWPIWINSEPNRVKEKIINWSIVYKTDGSLRRWSWAIPNFEWRETYFTLSFSFLWFLLRRKQRGLNTNHSAAAASRPAPDVTADMQPFSFSSEHLWSAWIPAPPPLPNPHGVFRCRPLCQSQQHVWVFQKLLVNLAVSVFFFYSFPKDELIFCCR